MDRRLVLVLALIMLTMVMMVAPGCGRPAGPGPEPSSPALPTTPSGNPPEPTPPPVQRPEPSLSFYEPSDLLAGRTAPFLYLPGHAPGAGFALSPDRKSLLLFHADFMIPGPAPHIRSLATGKVTMLGLSVEEASSFTYGGWLPDGRLILVGGQKVWIGSGDGSNLQVLTPEGAWGWITELSPTGTHLAVWSPMGTTSIIDLKTGAILALKGTFRRGCQDCGTTIGWSPDGKYLAGTDFDSDAMPKDPHLRIVDIATGKVARTIEDWAFTAWLPTGEILTYKVGEDPRAGALLDPTGKFLKATPWGFPSPDGRYLLQHGSDGAEQVIEMATGKAVKLSAGGSYGWTAEGLLWRVTY